MKEYTYFNYCDKIAIELFLMIGACIYETNLSLSYGIINDS